MVPQRGEVWLFDCGMVEKVRPVLVVSIPFADTDRAVVTVVFHSTALRGSQFEVNVNVPFLKEGVFIAQSRATYPTKRAIRKLGALSRRAAPRREDFRCASCNAVRMADFNPIQAPGLRMTGGARPPGAPSAANPTARPAVAPYQRKLNGGIQDE